MEKVYRLLDWINKGQAVDWLQELTSTPLAYVDLLRLCDAGLCIVYLDCMYRKGEMAVDVGMDTPIYQPVIGQGMCVVEYPMQLADPNSQGIHVIGPALVECTEKVINDCGYWIPETDQNPRAQFKPSEIQALAAKMNGGSNPPSNVELEGLRQQLAQARANLDNVEARRETLRLRCSYTNQLLESAQAENAQLRELLTDGDAKLKKQTIEQPGSEVGAPDTGLTFPYATKHLEAMQEAAIKHWADHDRSKPAPYGIQKAVQNFLAERTGENSRKVAELAAAIKPDDLPKS